MSEEWKNRGWYVKARDMWFDHFKIEMHPNNRKQIADVEQEFNRYWIAAGHPLPPQCSRAQLFYDFSY